MHRILLIGAGQLGSRHLQSLGMSEMPLELIVLDPSETSLNLARKRFEEIPERKNIIRIDYVKEINQISDEIDVAIIATLSDVRSEVTRTLIKSIEVKYIIFEKVLFQHLKDYSEISQLLRTIGVKAWVNCPRRLYTVYKDIKETISSVCCISLYYFGGEWAMASNSIHLIDLLSYLSRKVDFIYSISGLDNRIKESKRKGFIEITGTLKAHHANGCELILHSRDRSKTPAVLAILADDQQIIIDEKNGILRQSCIKTNWEWEEKIFKVPIQSELTHLVVSDLIEKRECDLVDFEESCKLHLPFLEAVIRQIELSTGDKSEYCPIT